MRAKFLKIFLIILLIILTNNFVYGEETAEFYNKKGLSYYKEEKYEEAEFQFKKAIEVEANYVSAYYNLGVLYADENVRRYSEAMEEFKKVIDLNYRDRKAHYHLARLYKREGMYEKAMEEYEKALEVSSSVSVSELKEDKTILRKELWLFLLFQIGLVAALL